MKSATIAVSELPPKKDAAFAERDHGSALRHTDLSAASGRHQQEKHSPVQPHELAQQQGAHPGQWPSTR